MEGPDSASALTRLPPVDEADRDPELVVFRDKLLAAVRARDWEALKEQMYFRIGFGPDYFDAKIRLLGDFWGMPSPESPFWWKLERALAWGGRFNPGGVFAAPGLDLAWPADLDRKRCLVAVGPEVPLREAASPDAPAIAYLSYDVVELVPLPGMADLPFDEHYDWHTNRADHGQRGYSLKGFHHVRTAAGQVGFVDHHQLLSPLEHQAYLARIDEGRWWSMVAFVAPGAERPPT